MNRDKRITVVDGYVKEIPKRSGFRPYLPSSSFSFSLFFSFLGPPSFYEFFFSVKSFGDYSLFFSYLYIFLLFSG